MEDLIMTYIVESICPTENLVTIYYRNNLDNANKLAQFLKDEYSVETEIYTEYDYMKLHPDKFSEHMFDNIFEPDEIKSKCPDYAEIENSIDPDYDEELEYQRRHCESWAY